MEKVREGWLVTRRTGTQQVIKVFSRQAYENVIRAAIHSRELNQLYYEKCKQVKDIVENLERRAAEADAEGQTAVAGAYLIAIWTIKDITGIGGISDEQKNLIDIFNAL